MFSFDGSYKRTPSQRLGGASQTNDRETLIRRAQQERQKRAECRKQQIGAVVIQSHVRSFLIRIKYKQLAREQFDQHVQTAGLTNDQQVEHLVKSLIFFYYIKNERDGERLVCSITCVKMCAVCQHTNKTNG